MEGNKITVILPRRLFSKSEIIDIVRIFDFLGADDVGRVSILRDTIQTTVLSNVTASTI